MNAAEAREFPVAVLASISTGRLLCDFGAMHEAAEFLMGHPIWTHHFADKELWLKMKESVLRQCPSLPAELDDVTSANVLARVAELEQRIGTTASILRGSGATAKHPLDGIPEGKPVVIVR